MNATVARFSAALGRAYSRPVERIEDQIDFDDKYQHLFTSEYDTTMKIATATDQQELLDTLMNVLLDLYVKHASHPNNIHYHRSDQLFFVLLEHAKRTRTDKRDLFGEWAVEMRSDKATPLRRRYRELNRTYRSQVDVLINERRRNQSILDLLVDEYIAQHGYPPKDHGELYDFDPLPNDMLQSSFRDFRAAVDKVWMVVSGDNLEQAPLNVALAAYRAFLLSVARQGVLPLFQLIAYIQRRLITRREPVTGGVRKSDGDRSPVAVEMYAMALTQLLIVAQGTLALPRNRLRFTDTEVAYFLKPITDPDYGYLSNIKVRFGNALKSPDLAFAQSAAFLQLLLVQRSHCPAAELLPLGTTLAVQDFWQAAEHLKLLHQSADAAKQERLLKDPVNQTTLGLLERQLSIEVPIGAGSPDLASGVARVGASPGIHTTLGRVTIVYIEPENHDRFYVEFAALKPHLFVVHTAFITDKLYASRILEVYRATIGIVFLAQAFLMVCGFMLPFIEAGFAGLVKEILIYLAASEVEDQAAKINPIFGKVAGFAAMVVTPRPLGRSPSRVAPAHREVSVLSAADAEALQRKRGIAEILKSGEAEVKLTADLNRGVGVHRGINTVVEKVSELRQRLEAAPAQHVQPHGQLATDYGVAFRTGGGGAGTTGGHGSRAAGGGHRGTAKPADARIARLENLQEYLEVEGYYGRLQPDELLEARKAVNAAKDALRRNRPFTEARQAVVNVLNACKEVTGEYVADVVIMSTYRDVKIIPVPVRKNGVPMLDRVYKVRSHGERHSKYLLVEVKGGLRTRLGEVTRKQYWLDGDQIVFREFKDQTVRQATGEWYYQKLMEIYRADPSRNRALVRDLFKAMKEGNVESAIIKSGRVRGEAGRFTDSDPKIVFNSDEVIQWFTGRELPFDAKPNKAGATKRTFP